MEYKIIHKPEDQRFETTVEGSKGFVTYEITDFDLDITHTIVPHAIEGRGVAAALVKAAYDYARENGLICMATCSYAYVWLKRHPEYMD